MKFTNKNYLFYFFLNHLSFKYIFIKVILSYFAKPNFIIYDEWFDEYLEKTKLEIKNRKITRFNYS